MHGLLSLTNIEDLQGFAEYGISKEMTSRRCIFHVFLSTTKSPSSFYCGDFAGGFD